MPSVSIRSRVAATSRIDFTPAHTTVVGTRDRVTRSADSSNVWFAPRCTPPRPPVANTAMPARAARCAVEATVVAPCPPRAATTARSRTLTFTTESSPGDRGQRLVVQADPHLAGDQRHRGRHGAAVPDDLLDLAGDREVGRPGQPVADDGRLQRHHGAPLGERRPHLVGQHDHGRLLVMRRSLTSDPARLATCPQTRSRTPRTGRRTSSCATAGSCTCGRSGRTTPRPSRSSTPARARSRSTCGSSPRWPGCRTASCSGSRTSTTTTGSGWWPPWTTRSSGSAATTGSRGPRRRWRSTSRTPTRAAGSARCCWSTSRRRRASAGSTSSWRTSCRRTAR